MSTESYKHKSQKRTLIPSHEEAGQEAESPALKDKPAHADFPRNPVTTRGQDPELFWMGKHGLNDDEDATRVDIRSLYRHEHIVPENLIKGLYRMVEATDDGTGVKEEYTQPDFFSIPEAFGNDIKADELEKQTSYYSHANGWSNRLVQGDSLLVMNSLLNREGMAGQVQCCYFDPPYGIKYGSNWQIKLNNRTVKDGDDDSLTGEPEQVKAFRDTWELGIHSYLSYLRDRLLVARELLHESGSCFVQISDENVHLVRSLMDEVFGSDNFVGMISFVTTSGRTSSAIPTICDYLIWYSKDHASLKYRQLFVNKVPQASGGWAFNFMELADGTRRPLTADERKGDKSLPDGARLYQLSDLTSSHEYSLGAQPFEFNGRKFSPGKRYWSTSPRGMERLATARRLCESENSLRYVRFFDDFPVQPLMNMWTDATQAGYVDSKTYVVQTLTKVVQRCVLMTTDPGDLVLDPTCGSGTSAYVAEQWGRRWIAIDTSRIALNIAKTRLMTATFPYYRLHDERGDVRQGFIYTKVAHVTMKSIANDELPDEKTLYDQPSEDKKRLRVAGPFTVETLQNYEPAAPESLRTQDAGEEAEDMARFEQRIFAHLQSAGIKTGDKRENAVFHHIERMVSTWIHAEGFYRGDDGSERKAYLHIGPKFGTVSKVAVNEAIKECRAKGDADWLVILGFSFESDIENSEVKHTAEKVKHYHLGSFQVTKVRMHDDLMQEGLIKKDKKAASFVTIGEPDLRLSRANDSVIVEVAGLDIYDPIKDIVNSRNVADIAYWMLDDDYDGSNFVVRQVLFCGSTDHDEFTDWQKGLNKLAEASTRARAQRTLRVEIDEDAFSRLYGHKSHPIPITHDNQRIAVRVISQFGEETTKVLDVDINQLPDAHGTKYEKPAKAAKKAASKTAKNAAKAEPGTKAVRVQRKPGT